MPKNDQVVGFDMGQEQIVKVRQQIMIILNNEEDIIILNYKQIQMQKRSYKMYPNVDEIKVRNIDANEKPI